MTGSWTNIGGGVKAAVDGMLDSLSGDDGAPYGYNGGGKKVGHGDYSNGHGQGGSYKKCAESHPPYEIAPGITIYGGACRDPVIKDADVYIGFDTSMPTTPQSFPWNPGYEIYFRVPDRDVPQDADEYDKLLDWTAEQLLAGKKVHAGCIGGHGRTGTFLAALRFKLTGDADSIKHVRDHYCQKAVESQKQVDWLHNRYGLTQYAPTDKGRHKGSGAGKTGPGGQSTLNFGSFKHGKGYSSRVTIEASKDSVGSIWKPGL